ncbi:MAG: hypothetical protein Q9176_007459 [Flavoplaca citrina]
MFAALTCFAALLALTIDQCKALSLPPVARSLAITPAALIPMPFPASPGPGKPLEDIQIQCNPSLGTGINYASCLDAFGIFKRGTSNIPITVGQRYEPVTMSIPVRWISGMICSSKFTWLLDRLGSQANGRLPFVSRRTLGYQIARAAWQLMNQCVRDSGGQGGVVSGIGQSGSLGVFIRKNNPDNVQCNEEPQTYGRDACAQLLLSLPAAVQPRRIFGAYAVRAAGQRVDELIPTYYANDPPHHQCRIGIWPIDEEEVMTIVDTATWFEVWQAATALVGMCARKGLSGDFLNFGTNRGLRITLDDNSDPILENAPPGANVTVVHLPVDGQRKKNGTIVVAK